MVYYASKTLNEAQRNYITTEKELLAVVYALDKFQVFFCWVGHNSIHESLSLEIPAHQTKC